MCKSGIVNKQKKLTVESRKDVEPMDVLNDFR